MEYWNSNIFNGYFIFGGTISANKNNDQILLVNSLVRRVKEEKIEEVIIATRYCRRTNTAFYIEDSLKNLDVKVTKLAQGLPVGGEIENLDDGTLFSAFKNRTNI